jgi:hypothetical protein
MSSECLVLNKNHLVSISDDGILEIRLFKKTANVIILGDTIRPAVYPKSLLSQDFLDGVLLHVPHGMCI